MLVLKCHDAPGWAKKKKSVFGREANELSRSYKRKYYQQKR